MSRGSAPPAGQTAAAPTDHRPTARRARRSARRGPQRDAGGGGLLGPRGEPDLRARPLLLHATPPAGAPLPELQARALGEHRAVQGPPRGEHGPLPGLRPLLGRPGLLEHHAGPPRRAGTPARSGPRPGLAELGPPLARRRGGGPLGASPARLVCLPRRGGAAAPLPGPLAAQVRGLLRPRDDHSTLPRPAPGSAG